MTAALEGGEWSAARPGRTYPRERPGTHFTGGWVGPRAGLEGEKYRPHRDSIPNRPAQSLYRLSYPAHSYYYMWVTGSVVCPPATAISARFTANCMCQQC